MKIVFLETGNLGEDMRFERFFEDSDRLLITPHIAWAAVEARTRLVDELWLNLDAFINGEERNVCRK